MKIDPNVPKQLNLFPQTNPFLEELEKIDVNTISPIEALNKIYEWKKRFINEGH